MEQIIRRIFFSILPDKPGEKRQKSRAGKTNSHQHPQDNKITVLVRDRESKD
jgi:hypothetical protein